MALFSELFRNCTHNRYVNPYLYLAYAKLMIFFAPRNYCVKNKKNLEYMNESFRAERWHVLPWLHPFSGPFHATRHQAGKYSHHHLGFDLHQVLRQSVEPRSDLSRHGDGIPEEKNGMTT